MWRALITVPRRVSVFPVYLALTAGSLGAGDWPYYRGPAGDGVSMENIRTNWSAEAPKEVWRVPLGAGLSSLSIHGGRVYTLVKRNVAGQNRELVVALDAASGAELWGTPFDTANYPNGGVGDDDGPRSTPAVDGDRVYAFGAYLKLVCLSATNGALLWSRDFVAEYGSTVIAWQNAASPLIDGDQVLVNCNASGGRLLAVNKMTGSNVWRLHADDRMTQATPVLATMEGVRQAIFFAQSGLVSVDPASGGLLWRYALTYNGTSTAASPVVGEGVVYGSAAYGQGAGLVQPTQVGGQFTATEVWRKAGDLQNHWCTPVYWQGHFYGHYNQSGLEFQCVEAATGDQKWAVNGFGYGSVLVVGGWLLVPSADGVLVLVDPDPTAYREITRHRALTGKCWNAPAVSNGRIYVRSTLQAVCLDVSVPGPPPLRLEAIPMVGAGPFRLRVSAADGSVLPPDTLTGAQLLASSDPAEPLAQWAALSLTPVATPGGWEFEDPQSTNLSQRFYLLQQGD